MKNILSILHQRADEAIRLAFSSVFEDRSLFESEITMSTQPQFGHYQCNNALKLAKELKDNPRQVAQKIIDNLPSAI